MSKQKPFPCCVYIAISAQGYPCPFIGFAYTARELRANYVKQFTHTMKHAGYRVIRVEMHDMCAEKTWIEFSPRVRKQ